MTLKSVIMISHIVALSLTSVAVSALMILVISFTSVGMSPEKEMSINPISTSESSYVSIAWIASLNSKELSGSPCWEHFFRNNLIAEHVGRKLDAIKLRSVIHHHIKKKVSSYDVESDGKVEFEHHMIRWK